MYFNKYKSLKPFAENLSERLGFIGYIHLNGRVYPR